MRDPEYLPDRSSEWKSPADLPKPTVRLEKKNLDFAPCIKCGLPAARHRLVKRLLHDIGDISTKTPQDVHFEYSQHHCKPCRFFFNAEFPRWIPGKLHYTKSVVEIAILLVVEDGLPYEGASWHLWRDHCVFVPAGTIQNWVEASGKKSGGHRGERVSRQGTRRLLRLHRRRRGV